MAASGLSGLIPYAVNFSLAAGVFVFATRKHIAKYVYQRHETQKDLLNAAAKEKEAAEKRFKEIQSLLDKMDQDIAELAKVMTKEGAEEAAKILAKAKSDCVRIEEDSDRIIENEKAEMVQKIKESVLNEALSKVEKILREDLKKEDHNAIIQAAQNYIGAKS